MEKACGTLKHASLFYWNKNEHHTIILTRFNMRSKLATVSAVLTFSAIAAAAIMTNAPSHTEAVINTSATPKKATTATKAERFDGVKLVRPNEEWKKLLSPEQFYILREKATEQPYTGKYEKNKRPGTYHCAACDLALFHSSAKFESGTGWPSFYKPIYNENIREEEDRSIDEVRTEVICARCGGHLGHVFDDGPEPTGLRYCINSAALKFKPIR